MHDQTRKPPRGENEMPNTTTQPTPWPPGVTARYTTAYGHQFLDRTAYVEVTATNVRCTGCPAICPPGADLHIWAQKHANTCTGQPRS